MVYFVFPEFPIKLKRVHNLGSVLSELESQEQGKLAVKLSSIDVRSLLFSKGVIFVEGLSDKIVVEQIDRHFSMKNEGPRIDESEWSVMNIGGKKSLLSFNNTSVQFLYSSTSTVILATIFCLCFLL